MNDEPKNMLSLSELTPKKEELIQLAESAKAVDVTNVVQVHDKRMMLREARVTLTKVGKVLREGAIQFQKDVISKERELIAIIEPEEERLSRIEDELKLKAEMEKRREELPNRLAALATIGDSMEVTDDEILAMDDDEFNAYRVRRIDAKLVKDRADHEAKVKADEDAARARAAEEDRIRREKLEQDERDAKARRDAADKEAAEKRAAEQKLIDEEKAKVAAEAARLAGIEEERKRQEAAALAETERKEREAKAEREREAERQKAERYQKFLADNKYDESTDVVLPRKDGTGVDIYRKVAGYSYDV